MSLSALIIDTVIALIAGIGLGYFVFKSQARKKGVNLVKKAEKEAEAIKKDKILQAKEKFLELKTEHEQVINERNRKAEETEKRAIQKEQKINSLPIHHFFVHQFLVENNQQEK